MECTPGELGAARIGVGHSEEVGRVDAEQLERAPRDRRGAGRRTRTRELHRALEVANTLLVDPEVGRQDYAEPTSSDPDFELFEDRVDR